MSLNRLVFIVPAFALGACAFAAEVHCPQTLNVHGSAYPLDDASVFDGQPEELADLMPNLETSEWDIAMEQAAGKAEGRSMYLVCRYKGLKQTVKRLIPREATLCKVEGTANGAIAVWCKSSRRQPKQTTKEAHGHQS